MGISCEEQETVIQISRNESTCNIYTSDITMMTRLDKLYRVIKEYRYDGEVVAKIYETDKRMMSFRTDPNYDPPKKVVSEKHIKKRRIKYLFKIKQYI